MAKGQAIICSLITMQHDDSHWPDAQVFKPERWLDPSPEAELRRQHAWKPFGGPLYCLKHVRIRLISPQLSPI